MINAGTSTCPLCQEFWLVTPKRDCFLPACGCYGEDTSAANPDRPCEQCGLSHAFGCPRLGRREVG